MFSTSTILLSIVGYAIALFFVAQWAERTKSGAKLANHPAVYALGLAVYCTTWTYYGSVGKASVGGMGYLPVYLGPTLALLVGGSFLIKVAKIKHAHRITSIADFISARYGRSQSVAALVTIILMVGIVPYVGLQLKALTGSVGLLSESAGASGGASWFSPLIAGMMAVFTIMFGIRHLDPTERHPGMVVSLAAESIFKLVAFIAAAIFVVTLAFGDMGGFVEHIKNTDLGLTTMGRGDSTQVMVWITVTVLSMSAFLFLPRQFHVAIVENGSPKHIQTARWMTPLYLILINAFVLPIATGGNLIGAEGMKGDQYVLALPIQNGNAALSMAVFLGGLSAGIGMIMISAMTMATMISNHLVMPAVQKFQFLRPLQRRMLQVRWVAATSFIYAGYGFEVGIGDSYMLVAIGLISFAAAFILAPVMVLGVYWPSASKAGALAGLSTGFAVWFYTLLMPTFAKSGWIPESILTEGPFGIGWARPEALFGLQLHNLVHGVIWTGASTLLAYTVGTLVSPADREERILTDRFLDTTGSATVGGDTKKTLPVAEKRSITKELFARFFSDEEAEQHTERVLHDAGLAAEQVMSAVEMAELYNRVEQTLAGAIGAATAHATMKEWGEVDRQTADELTASYARMMAELKLSPREIAERIDYQADKESLLEEQFAELQAKVDERDAEIVQRKKAEVELQQAHDELEDRVRARTAELAERNEAMRLVLDNVDQGFITVNTKGEMASERSAIVSRWMQSKDAATIMDLISSHNSDVAAMVGMGLSDLEDGFMPPEVILDQIPSRVRVGERTLSMRFDPIVREEAIDALLAVLTDITPELERERMEERQNEMLSAFQALSTDRLGFSGFMSETETLISRVESNTSMPANECFRLVHTLKGNAGVFGMVSLVHVCHAFEDELQESDEVPAHHVTLLRETWDSLRNDLGTLVGPEGAKVVEVDFDAFERLRQEIEQGASPETIQARLESWLLEPADVRLERLGQQAIGLADRLGKTGLQTKVETDGLRLPHDEYKPFWSSLVHVARNAIDHGLEAADDREAAGKSREGTLTLRAKSTDSGFMVEVSDDGGGIQWDRVAEKAKSMDMPYEKHEDLVAALFTDGLSTAEEVSEVSGRGVGMAAVKAEIESFGGTIEIDSELGKGTTFRFHFPERADELVAA